MQRFDDSQKDLKAFKEKSNEVCYIPLHAEFKEDCFSYEMLVKECKNYLESLELDLNKELDHYSKLLVNPLFHNLTWEFPSTYLDELGIESTEELKQILNIKS